METNWQQNRTPEDLHLSAAPSRYGSINFKKLSVLALIISDVLSHRIAYNFEIDSEVQRFFRESTPFKSNNELIINLGSTYEGAESTKIKTDGVHSWDSKSFIKFQKCSFCQKFIIGFHHHGFQCKVCGIVGHEQCLTRIDKKSQCKADVCEKKKLNQIIVNIIIIIIPFSFLFSSWFHY